MVTCKYQIALLFTFLVLSINKAVSQLDLTFNSPVSQQADSSRFDGTVKAIARQKDGKYLIGGNFKSYNGRSRNNFCRLLANGNLDDNFIATSVFDREVHCIAVQADGKILIGGEFNAYNGQPASKMIRLNENGSVDNSFAIGLAFKGREINSILIQPDGKILVGGEFTAFNGGEVNALIRLNQDGSVDSKFDAGFKKPSSNVHSIALQKNKILVAGHLSNSDGKRHGLLRLNNNGGEDIGFNLGGDGFGMNTRISKMILQPDNKIIVLGHFNKYNTTEYKGDIIRLGENGWIDKKFNLGKGFGENNISSWYHDAVVDDAGNIYVAGKFTQFENAVRVGLLRLLPDGTLDKEHVNANIFQGVIVYSLFKNEDGTIVAGGDFGRLGNFKRNGIAMMDKEGNIVQQAFNLYVGFDDAAKIIVAFKDNKYLVAGSFNTYNSRYVNGILSIDENGNLDNSFLFPFYQYEIKEITDIKIQQDKKILIAGGFRNIKDRQSYSLIRLLPDGKPDEQFFTGGGFVGDYGKTLVRTLELQTDGKILAGGFFKTYDGIPVNGIVRLNENGSLDNSFKTEIPTETKKILLDKAGNILVIGKASYTPKAVVGVLRYTTTGKLDTKFDIRAYANADFTTAALQADGKIIFWGTFITTQNKYYEGLLRVNTDGTIDQSFKLDSRIDECGNEISHLNILPDNSILVGFSSRANNTPNTAFMFGLIKVAPDGMLKGFPFKNGFVGTAGSNSNFIGSTVLTNNNKIIVAGAFAKVDDYYVWNLAKLNNEVVVNLEKNVRNTTTIKTPEPKTPNTTNELSFLYAYNGKDPYTIKLWSHIKLKTRIKTLLGDDYATITEIVQNKHTGSKAVTIKNDLAHLSLEGAYGKNAWILDIIIDIKGNKIYVIENSNTVHSEDKTGKIPEEYLRLFNLSVNTE